MQALRANEAAISDVWMESVEEATARKRKLEWKNVEENEEEQNDAARRKRGGDDDDDDDEDDMKSAAYAHEQEVEDAINDFVLFGDDFEYYEGSCGCCDCLEYDESEWQQ